MRAKTPLLGTFQALVELKDVARIARDAGTPVVIDDDDDDDDIRLERSSDEMIVICRSLSIFASRSESQRDVPRRYQIRCFFTFVCRTPTA
jgi:hypothetical protein